MQNYHSSQDVFSLAELYESLNKVNSLYLNLLDFVALALMHSLWCFYSGSFWYVHCFLELATLSSFLFKILFVDKSVGNDNLSQTGKVSARQTEKNLLANRNPNSKHSLEFLLKSLLDFLLDSLLDSLLKPASDQYAI